MYTKIFAASALTIALGSLSLWSPNRIFVAAQDGGDVKETPEFKAFVTLSFESAYGSTSDIVNGVLSSSTILGSIHPSLTRDEGHDISKGEAAFQLEAVSENIVAIRVRSHDATLTKEAVDALLKQIPKFEPGDAAATKLRLKEADEMLALALAEVEAANEARTAFIQKNGPLDPHESYQRTQLELAERTRDLEQARFELATQSAMRELFKELLAKEPATVEERRMIPNAKKVLLERQLEAITNIPLSPVLEKSIAGDISAFLHSQERWIVEIEKQLTDATLADTEIISKVTNPRRSELESQLFDTDRTLADFKSREQALAPRVEALRSGAMLGWKLQSDWEMLTSRHDRATSNIESAREILRDARESARQFSRGPWMKVLSGPTTSPR
ncbi:MAG: hypothetical protein ACKVS6_07775 [Planctomycetota bacterium]